MFWFKKNKSQENQNYLEMLDKKNIPQHIAIIMDGNGRWAKKEIYQEHLDIEQVLKQ